MTLRCKPGDLCVIVNAGGKCASHIGKIIRVIKVFHKSELPRGPWVWTYEGPHLVATDGTVVAWANDCALRPLRDAPGQDETLRLAGRPNPTMVTDGRRYEWVPVTKQL